MKEKKEEQEVIAEIKYICEIYFHSGLNMDETIKNIKRELKKVRK